MEFRFSLRRCRPSQEIQISDAVTVKEPSIPIFVLYS